MLTAPSNITYNSLTVNWTAVPNAENYYLDITTDPNFVTFDAYPANQEIAGNLTSKNLSGLSANTRYYYRVRALTTNGMTGNSIAANVRTWSLLAIISFSPISGPVGTTVTINGTNFSTTPTNNIVYFGRVKATVTAATSTSLTVSVPPGVGSIVPVSVANGNAIALSDASTTPFFTITNSPAASMYYERYIVDLTKPEAGFVDSNSNYYTSKAAAGFGDFNGDGNVDYIVTEYTPQVVTFYAGNGKGRFERKKSYPIEHVPCYTPVIGDFNGDGKLDFAIPNADYVGVYLGDGTGDFTQKGNFSTGSKPMNIAVSDINGDGIEDIVTANYGSANVSVLQGVGDGTFKAPVNFQSGAGPTCISVNDMNNDGYPDIITNSIADGTILIFLNDGSGNFGSPLVTFVREKPYKFTIFDKNKDGILDLVAIGIENNNLI